MTRGEVLHTQTYVTESGERRRVEFARDADTGRAVRREFREVNGEWVAAGAERLRELKLDGEPRTPVDLRTVLSE